ncbi:hypothetical protein RHMOL_Rhmol11G0076900 [Rhododendron molle]|uniref:Uncharacterized protein n=1 Tax=Rhododendron molle TaxID=49168 RepID=A0ACC0LPT6_RHOML|nr:hypothetical protein RHMOL_Rhmol11G0076900 [Rhododendron molle]
MGNEEDIDEDEFYVQSKPPPKRPAATATSGSKFQLKKPKTKGPLDAYFTPDLEIELSLKYVSYVTVKYEEEFAHSYEVICRDIDIVFIYEIERNKSLKMRDV